MTDERNVSLSGTSSAVFKEWATNEPDIRNKECKVFFLSLVAIRKWLHFTFVRAMKTENLYSLPVDVLKVHISLIYCCCYLMSGLFELSRRPVFQTASRSTVSTAWFWHLSRYFTVNLFFFGQQIEKKRPGVFKETSGNFPTVFPMTNHTC